MNGALFRGGEVYRISPWIGARLLRARVTFSTGNACVRSPGLCGLLWEGSVAAKRGWHYMLWLFIFKAHYVVLSRFLWERPCVANGPQSGPANHAAKLQSWGRFAPQSRHRAAPTVTAFCEKSCSFAEPRERWSKGKVSPGCRYKNAARGTQGHPVRHSGLTGRLRSLARRSRRPSALALGLLPGPGRCRHRWKRR